MFFRTNWNSKADPFREFTDATWILIAIMLDEENLSLPQIAIRLIRNPAILIQTVESTKGQAKLKQTREKLLQKGGVYAIRYQKRQEAML